MSCRRARESALGVNAYGRGTVDSVSLSWYIGYINISYTTGGYDLGKMTHGY